MNDLMKLAQEMRDIHTDDDLNRSDIYRWAGQLESLAKGAEPVAWHASAADAVITTLADFGGFDGWWDNIDEECRREIVSDIATAIHDQAPTAPVAVPKVPDEKFLHSVVNLCGAYGPTPEYIEDQDEDSKWIADLWRAADKMLAQSPTVAADDRRDAEQLGIGKAIERAAKELPEGWAIEISVSKDGGSIDLINPEAEGVDFPTNHEHWSQEINDAIDAAMAKGDGA